MKLNVLAAALVVTTFGAHSANASTIIPRTR